MGISKQVIVVDSHTMGEPTRIVVGGIPHIPGKTMALKKEYLMQNMDNIRTAVMHEPRGHSDMFGAIITVPCNDGADLGVVFMDGGGYLNMCGHGIIGVMTVLTEMGYINVSEPVTNIVLDTPAGLIKGRVLIENGKAKSVSFCNVASFLYKQDIIFDVPTIGTLKADISFGGSFFCILNASSVGVNIIPSNVKNISDVGMKILHSINEQVKVEHPTLKHINKIELVELYGDAQKGSSRLRNVVIFGNGQIDRSPCGTGTSAKLAQMHAKGEIGVGEDFVYESIIGTQFSCKIIEVLEQNGFTMIKPEITAQAFITGINNLFIDADDPLKYGFSML